MAVRNMPLLIMRRIIGEVASGLVPVERAIAVRTGARWLIGVAIVAVLAMAYPFLPDTVAESAAAAEVARVPRLRPAAGMTQPLPGASSFAGVNFWNVDWQGQNEYFREGTDFSRTSDPWRKDLLEDLAPYRVLRFMDWANTNAEQTSESHFATRKQKTSAQNQPVALEWQIDLCNRTEKDCWLTFHHLATEEDLRSAAQLIKASLKPSLRVYVEWSNEIWNGAFPQGRYAVSAARRLSLPGQNPAAAYLVHESVRLFEVFDQVFAADSQRVVRVLSGQSVWTGPCESHLEALKDPRINPRGTWPDVYAIAPYLYGETIDALTRNIPEAAKGVAAHAACAKTMGVPLISYEGGTDSFSLGAGCTKLQHSAGMRLLYTQYLDALTAAGLRGPFMQYTYSGGCWGLKERTGDRISDAPKLQGFMDWLRKVDPPPSG